MILHAALLVVDGVDKNRVLNQEKRSTPSNV